MNAKPRILVVDDEPNIRSAIATILDRSGYAVESAADPGEADRLLGHSDCHVILLDLRMPGANGLECLHRWKSERPDTEIIVVTAFGSVATAVEAMRLGAYDYLQKPIDRERLPIVVKKAVERHLLSAENKALKERLARRNGCGSLIGHSPAMLRVYELIDLVAGSDATVLIAGESGVGKERVARAIYERGPRANGPFIAVNCGALPEALQESELFGYERGAFTGATTTKPGRFELAHEGVLFLDEVGEMSAKTQVDFLRVLESREFRRVGGTRLVKVDVRIVAATNRDLKKAVEEGRFREDLYYRLNVVPIRVPSLRERADDLPLLIEAFLDEFATTYQRERQVLAPETLERFTDYPWPGNVRELRNLLERLVITSRESVIGPVHLPAEMLNEVPVRMDGNRLAGKSLRDIEKHAIIETLRNVTSHREKAAKILGISPRALQYKIKEYGIDA
ncbi:MAG: sigma-54 dependent transcriptional regulator [Nitrospirota bacterium]